MAVFGAGDGRVCFGWETWEAEVEVPFTGFWASKRKKSSSTRGIEGTWFVFGGFHEFVPTVLLPLVNSGIGLMNTISPFSLISKLEPPFMRGGSAGGNRSIGLE